jgi:hypothetical protein
VAGDQGGSKRALWYACLGAAAAALAPAAAGARPAPMPHHHQMDALYVIDHNGRNPKSDAALVPYSRPFEKILGGCRIGVDDLMTAALDLSDQASEVGGRNVTSLQLLKAVARRVVWKGAPRSCIYVFHEAEGHLENGDP